MILRFDAGRIKMIDFNPHAQLPPSCLHHMRQLQHRELFGELIEYPEFTRIGWVQTCDFDTTHRVANIQESASLSAFPVYRQGMSHRRLRAEAVQNGTEDVVVIEAVNQGFVLSALLGDCSIHHALVQVRRAKTPDLAREGDVVAVMNLGEMIKGAGLLRERQHIGPSVVLNLYV